MALIDREYMRRDTAPKQSRPQVEKLLTRVKPARLVPASRQWLFLLIGLALGGAAGYWLPALISHLSGNVTFII